MGWYFRYISALTLGCITAFGCTDDDGNEASPVADMAPPTLDAGPADMAQPPPDLAPPAPDAGPPPTLEGATVSVPEGLPTLSIQPALAFDAQGQLAVAGCGGEEGNDGDLGIWFALFADDGTVVQAPAALDTTTTGIQNEPSICALADGGFAVVWSMDGQAQNEDGQNLYVRGRLVDAAGTPIGASDFEIHSGSPGNHWLADVACDPRGGFLVVGARSEENDTFGVFAQRFDSDATPTGEPIILNSDPMGTQAFPTAAFDANGDAVIAWEDNPFDTEPDSVTRIVAKRLPADATTPPDRAIILTRPLYDALRPRIAADPASGGFVVGTTLDNRHVGVYTVRADDTVTEVMVPRDGVRHSPALVAVGHDRYLLLHSQGVNMGASPTLALIDGEQIAGDLVPLGTGNLPPYSLALTHRAGRTAAAWTERNDEGQVVVHLARID